jgi:hypothetical protein
MKLMIILERKMVLNILEIFVKLLKKFGKILKNSFEISLDLIL